MIEIKEQTIKTSCYINDELVTIFVHIKEGKNENRITIQNRDIFFDKKGNCSGDGIDLTKTKEK